MTEALLSELGTKNLVKKSNAKLDSLLASGGGAPTLSQLVNEYPFEHGEGIGIGDEAFLNSNDGKVYKSNIGADGGVFTQNYPNIPGSNTGWFVQPGNLMEMSDGRVVFFSPETSNSNHHFHFYTNDLAYVGYQLLENVGSEGMIVNNYFGNRILKHPTLDRVFMVGGNVTTGRIYVYDYNTTTKQMELKDSSFTFSSSNFVETAKLVYDQTNSRLILCYYNDNSPDNVNVATLTDNPSTGVLTNNGTHSASGITTGSSNSRMIAAVDGTYLYVLHTREASDQSQIVRFSWSGSIYNSHSITTLTDTINMSGEEGLAWIRGNFLLISGQGQGWPWTNNDPGIMSLDITGGTVNPTAVDFINFDTDLGGTTLTFPEMFGDDVRWCQYAELHNKQENNAIRQSVFDPVNGTFGAPTTIKQLDFVRDRLVSDSSNSSTWSAMYNIDGKEVVTISVSDSRYNDSNNADLHYAIFGINFPAPTGSFRKIGKTQTSLVEKDATSNVPLRGSYIGTVNNASDTTGLNPGDLTSDGYLVVGTNIVIEKPVQPKAIGEPLTGIISLPVGGSDNTELLTGQKVVLKKVTGEVVKAPRKLEATAGGNIGFSDVFRLDNGNVVAFYSSGSTYRYNIWDKDGNIISDESTMPGSVDANPNSNLVGYPKMYKLPNKRDKFLLSRGNTANTQSILYEVTYDGYNNFNTNRSLVQMNGTNTTLQLVAFDYIPEKDVIVVMEGTNAYTALSIKTYDYVTGNELGSVAIDNPTYCNYAAVKYNATEDKIYAYFGNATGGTTVKVMRLGYNSGNSSYDNLEETQTITVNSQETSGSYENRPVLEIDEENEILFFSSIDTSSNMELYAVDISGGDIAASYIALTDPGLNANNERMIGYRYIDGYFYFLDETDDQIKRVRFNADANSWESVEVFFDIDSQINTSTSYAMFYKDEAALEYFLLYFDALENSDIRLIENADAFGEREIGTVSIEGVKGQTANVILKNHIKGTLVNYDSDSSLIGSVVGNLLILSTDLAIDLSNNTDNLLPKETQYVSVSSDTTIHTFTNLPVKVLGVVISNTSTSSYNMSLLRFVNDEVDLDLLEGTKDIPAQSSVFMPVDFVSHNDLVITGTASNTNVRAAIIYKELN
jgi:hypothetical protein